MENTESVPTIENIRTVEPTSTSFDATKFEGQRISIDKVEIIEVDDKFPDGKYDATSTQKKMVVEVTTAPIKQFHEDESGNITFGPEEVEYTDSEGNTKNIRINNRFNLQKEEGEWVISKNEKANLWIFMRKLGVTELSEIKGKIVTITSVPSKKPDDDRRFLSIVTK